MVNLGLAPQALYLRLLRRLNDLLCKAFSCSHAAAQRKRKSRFEFFSASFAAPLRRRVRDRFSLPKTYKRFT